MIFSRTKLELLTTLILPADPTLASVMLVLWPKISLLVTFEASLVSHTIAWVAEESCELYAPARSGCVFAKSESLAILAFN